MAAPSDFLLGFSLALEDVNWLKADAAAADCADCGLLGKDADLEEEVATGLGPVGRGRGAGRGGDSASHLPELRSDADGIGGSAGMTVPVLPQTE